MTYNTYHGEEFSVLDNVAKQEKLTTTETFTAQILLSVQLMINDAKINSNWLEWDQTDIVSFVKNKCAVPLSK